MLWRKVIVGNFGEEPSEWCSWVAREGYGVSLWKSIRKGLLNSVHVTFSFKKIDAWTYEAVDPNSGTVVLLDIARRYALMMRQGWQPRRTIVLCSWDAEEFGMIGSTEWVEQNLLNLGSKVVAYLNVDCAVQGPGFFAGATPQLDNLLIEVAKKVQDPDSESMTIYDNWMITNKVINIQRLSGVDSDFAPLLQHAGVPSVDLYYGRGNLCAQTCMHKGN
ncbi:putative glutamate carboxypeptidase PLA3 [Vitis vinifera]|uniref:Putative glutamate carboxypeptidase PLA3 n=1 Tax=Vitis vinifera TaxID=29760 RepID=A0A438G6D4_VITVI|nr:putative glutamate carboxypeptidase PLA3 [Vitis vinifera]